jgi:hypothetical protein
MTGPGVPGAVLHAGQVTLGDITLGQTDDFGVEWILSSLTGWDAGPSTGGVEQRASAHGGWLDTAYLAPRSVAVEGSLIANTWDDAEAALDRLYAAIPLNAPGWLYVNGGARTLQALVRQDGDPLVERSGGWARFSLAFVAPDPRRYSNTETTASTGLPQTSGGLSLPFSLPVSIGATTTAGVLTVTNEGNMAAPWTATLTGPVPAGATITHRGLSKTLRFPHAVDAGRTLAVAYDGSLSALLDGTAGRVVTGSPFFLEPGANEIAFAAPSYDAASLLSLTFRSAWK